MKCLHPFCPRGGDVASWDDVADNPVLRLQPADRAAFLAAVGTIGNDFGIQHPLTLPSEALTKRLFELCPCLYTQIDRRVTAGGIVHLCEIRVGDRISSATAAEAFDIQNPNDARIGFVHAPVTPGAAGGTVMEALCSEVLSNEGVPLMGIDPDGWPIWQSCAHVSLNGGQLNRLKTYGDILIPAAPTNILISVKSVAARERLLVSGNRFESIGFGFFNEPNEFWSPTKLNLTKRMGFTAIYIPRSTLDQIHQHLDTAGTSNYAVNINGTNLYRPLEDFGPDMKRVAGRVALDL